MSLWSLFAGLAQFLGALTLAFSIQDIVATGAWRKLFAMTLSADGRLLILLAGVVGMVAGWYIQHLSVIQAK